MKDREYLQQMLTAYSLNVDLHKIYGVAKSMFRENDDPMRKDYIPPTEHDNLEAYNLLADTMTGYEPNTKEVGYYVYETIMTKLINLWKSIELWYNTVYLPKANNEKNN